MLTRLAVLGHTFRTLLLRLWDAARDLLPIILVIVFFQGLVLRQPIPHFKQLIGGLVLIVVGLAFFLIGLELVDPWWPPSRRRVDWTSTVPASSSCRRWNAAPVSEADPSEPAFAKGSATGPSCSHIAGPAW